MNNQSLYDIMNDQEKTWLKSITDCIDVAELQQKLKKVKDTHKKTIIKARIENLTYLAI